MPLRVDNIRQTLEAVLAPTRLDIEDDSHRHAGHAGAKGGGHYRVYIVSAKFSGRTLIARHRMVYEALAEQMKGDIHALSLVTKAPDEIGE
ncbi:MAG: BolA family transcriptional regulator [Gammaproteobacteria bacterium]|jgi:BolA protein|uniref:BolA family protein n=1 Tax=Nevskia sp. TaxID=1929292 RepID=UPI00403704AB|nr:BolA family transcriptional regulator [Gammaproteobacteria bacterium]